MRERISTLLITSLGLKLHSSFTDPITTVYASYPTIFVKTVNKIVQEQCCHGNGSIFMKMMTSQVTQVTWLIGQLINPNNLHVSQNLNILILVLAKLEEKTKLTDYWPVYELVDDVTTTSYYSHIIP